MIFLGACSPQGEGGSPAPEQRVFLDEARALLTEGETALAIDLFTRAIASGESPVEARLERAKAHLAVGQLPQAIEDLGRAIKLDPKKADAHYYLGVAKARSKDLAGAIEAYGGAIGCLLYTSPSPRDKRQSRMPSSA